MKLKMYVLDKLPVHDTIWAMITGSDNNIYIAACCEYIGGMGAFLTRYNTKKDKIEYLLDIAEAVGEPPETGRASQCKIHYSMICDDDGILYGATHLSAPPKGENFYSPWHTWNDTKRRFRGAMLFAYDTRTGKVLSSDCIYPGEGCRAMALDRKRRRLYAVSYPRDHFFYYDLETKKTTDLGRIGNVNPQAIFLDKAGNAYTNDDFGQLVRYNMRTKGLEQLDVRVPHADYQNGLHSVLYDVVESPDGEYIYGVPWNTDPVLFRYRLGGTKQSDMENLGPTYAGQSGYRTSYIQSTHTGGLVFGKDGCLYYCANVPTGEPWPWNRCTNLVRMNPATLEKKKICQLKFGKFTTRYVSRGVRDMEGNLYFADVGNRPQRIYKARPDYPAAVRNRKESKDAIMRYWG
jgi:hypothetical protein